MTILFYMANGLVMPPAMFFISRFYKFRGRAINFRKLPISISIIFVTAVITGLQFVFPQIIVALQRDKDALLSGEFWRLITPLFVQPVGIWQCLFNGIFFLAFLPTAEYFYGRSLIIIYFGAGIAGQLFNYYWEKGGGGASTAIYGVIGALYMYVILNRRTLPKGYVFLPVAGFVGAIVLCFFEDGHAPSLLVGGILSLAFKGNEAMSERKLAEV